MVVTASSGKGGVRRGAGRKKLAPEIAKARGSKDVNEAAPAANGDAPEMPDWLGERAQEKWHELVADLRRMGILSSETRELLIAYCTAWEGWHIAMEIIAKDGVLGPDHRKHGLCVERDKHRDSMNRLLPEFGLTPSSRGKLVSLQPPKEDDAFNDVLEMMNPSGN